MDIKQLLDENFAEYKEYHIYALIILALVIFIFQIGQAMFVSRKIETFKNELKISEIKFSRFNNLQIDALKAIYDELVTFHYKNFRLFFPKVYSHDTFKKRANEWRNEYNLMMDLFHREKILLTPGLKTQVKSLEADFNVIYSTLETELKDLSLLEEKEGTNDVQFIYGNEDAETDYLKKKLNRLKEIPEIKRSEKTIKSFRNNVEKYFESLTK